MTQSKTISHWIDNKPFAGSSGATAPVTNPATGEVTGQVALGSAEDARAAIESVGKHTPDIIITDIYMPAGDGFELLNWLRNHGMAIPVIAMSGSSSSSGDYDQLSVAEHLGAAAVLDKPFRQSKLVETIDRVLAKRGAPPR